MNAAAAREDRPLRVLFVAGLVCLACSLFVTTTTGLLGPIIAENKDRVREQRILALVTRQPALRALFEELGGVDVRARAVELADGRYAEQIDPALFDAQREAEDPLESVALSAEADLAQIGRRAKHAVVYEVEREGRLELVLLPVYGHGYLSTLRGYLALAGDANTVVGLTFIEHGETPGLGAQIEDGDWLAQWEGKRVSDDSQRIRLGVATHEVAPGSPDEPYLVDGLSGATVTSDGVTHLIRFWLGPDGFGPYLRRIRP